MKELIEKMCELYPHIPKEDMEFYVATSMLCSDITDIQLSKDGDYIEMGAVHGRYIG